MQQFSENLSDAGLLDHSAECLRLSSHVNQHSQQEQLLKAVLVAGLYPNLIQVPHASRYSIYAGQLYTSHLFSKKIFQTFIFFFFLKTDSCKALYEKYCIH